MVITYLGKQSFKVQLGDTTLAFNPVGKDSKHKSARFGADVALISVDHPDYNGAAEVAYGDRQPFVVDGPGEYEIKEVFIKGIPSEASVGGLPDRQAGKKYLNTIYLLELDKIRLCFLGAFSGKLPADSRAAIENVDILFVPLTGALSAAEAYQLAVSFEPKVIIPMDYEKDSEAFKKFLKEGGAGKESPLEKLTVKLKDIEGKEAEIVVLEAAS